MSAADEAALVDYLARLNPEMLTTEEDVVRAVVAAGWVPHERVAEEQRARDYHDLRARKLEAAVDRVRALHSQPDDGLAPGKWCPACGDETPCRTLRALDGEPPVRGHSVECDCGYVVEDLSFEQAQRFVEQHADDEHEPRVIFPPSGGTVT